MNLPIFDYCSVEKDKNIKRILDHKGITNSTVFFCKRNNHIFEYDYHN